MFKKILIANRGEIALRVICACKDLGIRTVAVYSEADRHSLHTRFADEAICIGPAKSSRSYLDIPSVISAAEITNAEAVHPGYGFLSENADFAEVCETSHLTFIGPRPEVIRRMGLKQEARAAMDASRRADSARVRKASWPASEEALELAEGIGYPVMMKASAGGGGRGMRVVRSAEELPHLMAQAQNEAAAAFSNGDMYMEKLVENPRHIEFQILADNHGNVEVLGERECSIQRRHQKLIEESPSVAVTPELRKRISESLRVALKAIGYTNAGTVEFLMDASGNLYFIEVNARIQVEHPVTEMVTGIDLVKSQIRIAAGETSSRDPPLPPRQIDPPARPRPRMPHQRRASRDADALARPHHRLESPRRRRRPRRHRRVSRRRDPALLRFAGSQANHLRRQPHRSHRPHAPRPRHVRRRRHLHLDPPAPKNPRPPRLHRRQNRHRFPGAFGFAARKEVAVTPLLRRNPQRNWVRESDRRSRA